MNYNMEQNTVTALAVAAIVTPWITEIIKRLLPTDMNGKKALTLTMILSIVIAGGVLQYEGQLDWSNPGSLLVSAGAVLGVATAVYQYMKGAVQGPVDRLEAMVR